MPVLGYAASGQIHSQNQAFAAQRINRIGGAIIIKGHDRIAIVLLIASIDQRIKRQRILLGGGHFFFDQHTQHAALVGGQAQHAISVASAQRLAHEQPGRYHRWSNGR